MNKQVWVIEFSEEAQKQFNKLDRAVQNRIRNFLRMRLAPLNDPRVIGARLTGELSPFWRFRVGDYRIIADILEDRVIIQIVEVGHRRQIYT
jgi:mRNA interferase RelE/StbE